MGIFIDKLFDRTVPGLQKALDLGWRRNEALASNIANAETPMYRAVDLSFGSELQKAFGENHEVLLKTNPMHMDVSGASKAHLVPDYSGATKPDGNNVDIDIQMGKLVLNAGRYSTAASLVRKKLHMLRLAILRSFR